MHTFEIAFVCLGRVGLEGDAVVGLFGKGVTGLVENHRLVVLLLEELEQINFLVELSKALFQVLVFRLELSDMFSIKKLLSCVVDLRIGVLKVNLVVPSLLLNNL